MFPGWSLFEKLSLPVSFFMAYKDLPNIVLDSCLGLISFPGVPASLFSSHWAFQYTQSLLSFFLSLLYFGKERGECTYMHVHVCYVRNVFKPMCTHMQRSETDCWLLLCSLSILYIETLELHLNPRHNQSPGLASCLTLGFPCLSLPSAELLGGPPHLPSLTEGLGSALHPTPAQPYTGLGICSSSLMHT